MRSPRRAVPTAVLTAVLTAVPSVVLLAGTMPAADATRASRAPSQAQWERDVHQALRGARDYVRREAKASTMPAINLDIDNTSLASHYDSGRPVVDTLKLARVAQRHGVLVYFNTARPVSGLPRARRMLEAAGYPVDRICGRKAGQDVVGSKQACRAHLVADGYTIIANIGNRGTDLAGGDYQRGYKLPDYDGALG